MWYLLIGGLFLVLIALAVNWEIQKKANPRRVKQLSDFDILALIRQYGMLNAINDVAENKGLNFAQAKSYVDNLTKQRQTNLDVRVDTSLLEQYKQAGYIDNNSLAKLKQAILNEKTYAYISHTDLEMMQAKAEGREYEPKEQSEPEAPQISSYKPRPVGYQSKDEARTLITVVGIMMVLVVVILLIYKPEKSDTVATSDIDSVDNPIDKSATLKDSSLKVAAKPDLVPHGNVDVRESLNEFTIQEDVKAQLSSVEIICLNVVVEEKGCLWVYALDNGQNWDNVSVALCNTARKYNIKCVSIFDANQNRLGRSFCD